MIKGKSATGVETREINWLWKPFIAYGKVTVIQGETGVGKTSLMVKMVADYSNGLKPPTQFRGRLLEQEQGEPIKTFYITTENGIEDTLVPMFDLFGGDREFLFYQDEDEAHFVLNGDEIREIVRQFDAKLIVVDPWQEFLDNTASTDNEALRAMIRDVQKAAEETGAAVVLCGNFSKSLGSDLRRGLGGSELNNTIRALLKVSPDPYECPDVRTMRTSKMSFLGKEMEPMAFQQDDDYRISYIQWQDHAVECEEKKAKKRLRGLFGGGDEEEEPKSQSDIAAEFLLEILADGPLDSNEVKRLAQERRISNYALNEGKKLAKVFTQQQSDKSSLWKLGEWR